MKTRIITGLVIAAIVIGLIEWAPFSVLTAVVLLISALTYLEYDRLFFPVKSITRQAAMISLTFLVVSSIREDLTWGLLASLLGFILISVAAVFKAPTDVNLETSVKKLALLFFGLIYISCLTGFLLPILESADEGRRLVLLLFFIVFWGDTAAYFAGSKFGKTKLAPLISPKKSVEGAIASVTMSLVISLIWVFCFQPEGFSNPFSFKLLLFTPVLSVLAQLGDLFESLLKRSVAVKDSGSVLPGHGGFLDRIDGLCFSTPVFYVFLKFYWENT